MLIPAPVFGGPRKCSLFVTFITFIYLLILYTLFLKVFVFNNVVFILTFNICFINLCKLVDFRDPG